MVFIPAFPTMLHEDAANFIRDYFLTIPDVDTILVVNSCARGRAVPESDLDFAIMVKPGIAATQIKNIETAWQAYSEVQPVILKYKHSHPYALLHLDIIEGNYTPAIMEEGGGPDYFEIEVGNQICYSAPMGNTGSYFKKLQKEWLPYYNEELRLERLLMTQKSCEYELNHIPGYIKRGLYFHAFDRLYIAFQKFLQALFIAKRVYPIAYNKWINEQVSGWLNLPGLYNDLLPVLSIHNIESNEMNDKAGLLKELLDKFTNT